MEIDKKLSRPETSQVTVKEYIKEQGVTTFLQLKTFVKDQNLWFGPNCDIIDFIESQSAIGNINYHGNIEGVGGFVWSRKFDESLPIFDVQDGIKILWHLGTLQRNRIDGVQSDLNESLEKAKKNLSEHVDGELFTQAINELITKNTSPKIKREHERQQQLHRILSNPETLKNLLLTINGISG